MYIEQVNNKYITDAGGKVAAFGVAMEVTECKKSIIPRISII